MGEELEEEHPDKGEDDTFKKNVGQKTLGKRKRKGIKWGRHNSWWWEERMNVNHITDGWTDGRTDGWTDGRTDGRTDGASYRDARTLLIMMFGDFCRF